MSLEVFQPAPFQYPHERETFLHLERALRMRVDNSTDPYVLVGNFHVGGRELDALFFGRGTIVVIEMKNYAGRVRFSENAAWTVSGNEMVESADGNPFRQVRNYRFLLMDYLGRKSRIARNTSGRPGMFIRGIVLFGRAITLENAVPNDISGWFDIVDLSTVARVLIDRSHNSVLPSAGDVEQLKRDLDLGRRIGIQPPAPPPQTAYKVILIKQADFRAALQMMRGSGLELAAAARQIEERIEEAKRFAFRNPFVDWRIRSDRRIDKSIIYSINDRAELVCLQDEAKIFPLFAGKPDEINEWLARNEGTVLTVDGNDHRLSLTVSTKSVEPPPPLPPPKVTSDAQPYLAQISCAELDAIMPGGLLRRELTKIDETTPDSQIDEALASLPEDSASLFRDLIRLLRAGDVLGAKARLGLRTGTTTLAVDLPSALSEAVEADANSDQIAVLTELSADELKQILQLDRFKEWMYFLHPDQRRYVEEEYEKPVVLTGVSGSGKTCILVHRARHLARKYPGERIGVFTLNRNLAGLLRDLIAELLTPEEQKNVHVFAYYDFFSDLLHELGTDAYLEQLARVAGENSHLAKVVAQVDRTKIAREFDARSNETIEDTWESFLESGDPDFERLIRPLTKQLFVERVNRGRYLREEFTLIRSMWTPEGRGIHYPGFDRSQFSRVVPFGQDIRSEILDLLLRYEEFMLAGGMLDVLSLTHALLPLRTKIRELPKERRFRFVLIDEFQDFSNLDLVILREICTHAAQDGLFLAGDLVQKILVKKLVLREAGFDNTAARWLKIRKNFRNSRQILAAASALAKEYGEQARSRKEEVEVLDPELAIRETARPFALKTDNPIDKAWEIAVRMVTHEKRAPWTICIATASRASYSVNQLLERKPENLPAQQLSEEWIKNRERVAVCDIGDLKGFEFHLVIIVGVEHSVFPETGVPKEERWRDALRLYVAMTRARDELYLVYQEEPSEFLEAMKTLLEWKEEPVTMDLGRRSGSPEPQRAGTPPDATWLINHEPDCMSWFTPIQVRHLREYFLLHVERVQNFHSMSPAERIRMETSKDGLFRMWLKPSVISKITHANLARIGKAGYALADEISRVMLSHGQKLADSHKPSSRTVG